MIRHLLLFTALLLSPQLSLPATVATAPAFSIADVTCPEAGPCLVTVRKSAGAKSWSRVTLTTADGTATAPGDYAAISVTLTFGNSQLAQTVAIPIVNDAAVEGSETFTLRLAAVRNAAIGRSPATVTILDDDVAPPPPPAARWVPAPLSDASGYVRARTACQSFGGGQRAAAAGEVFRMVIAVPYPKSDPSAWGWSAGMPGDGWRGQATLSVWPLDGSPSLVLPMACLEGVVPAP